MGWDGGKGPLATWGGIGEGRSAPEQVAHVPFELHGPAAGRAAAGGHLPKFQDQAAQPACVSVVCLDRMGLLHRWRALDCAARLAGTALGVPLVVDDTDTDDTETQMTQRHG
jgi:hypothetical protein